MANDPRLDELEVFVDTMLALYDWCSFPLEVAEAFHEKHSIPKVDPSGLVMTVIASKLEAVEEGLKAVEAPTFSTLPAVGNLPAEYDPLRDYLRTQVSTVQDATEEFFEQARRKQTVADLRSNTAAASEALESASRALELLIQVVPVIAVNEALQGNWLEIHEFQASLGRIRGRCRSVELTLTRAIGTRRGPLLQTIDVVISQLVVEQAALAGEEARMKAEWDRIESLQATLQHEAHELQRWRNAIEELREQIEGLRQEIRERRDQANGERNLASAVRKQFNEWVERERANWRCPENATYQSCVKHPDLRAAFDRDLQNSNNAREADRQARAHESRAQDLIRECEPFQQEINRIDEDIAQQNAELQLAEAEYDSHKADFEREREKALNERRRIRVTVHADASRQDQARLTTLAERVRQIP